MDTSCAYVCGDVYIENSICDSLSSDIAGYMQFAPTCCACRAQWKWIDNSVLDFYNWDAFEPSGRSALCGFSSFELNTKWKAGHCNSIKPFVCLKMGTHDIGDSVEADSQSGSDGNGKITHK